MRSSSARRRAAGFTVIEFLVATLIAGVVLGAAATFFTYQIGAMRTERARRSAQMTARTAMSLLVRQLEGIGRDPQGVLFASLDDATLPPAIVAADESSIHYRTNLSADEEDTDTQDAWEDVQFTVSSGAVWVTLGTAAPVPLTEAGGSESHVPPDGLELTYFDGMGDPVPDLTGDAARASVRRIRVRLTVRGGPAGDGGPDVTLSQDVYLRNAS